jgi:hypothetical protein
VKEFIYSCARSVIQVLLVYKFLAEITSVTVALLTVAELAERGNMKARK